MTKDEARERVQRGAALLDEKRPGWEKRIDVGVLDIAGPTCILFQLGGYSAVSSAIGVYEYHAVPLEVRSDHFGFHFHHGDGEMVSASDPGWRLLQDAWIEAIADRLVPTVDEGTAIDARFTPVAVGKA